MCLTRPTSPPISKRYEKIMAELKDYEYYGGDEKCHLNYWNQIKTRCPELESPPYVTRCYCGHEIVHNCYVYNLDTKHFVVVGNCCIRRFQKRRLCRTCKTPHSGKKYDQCPKCRKDEERLEQRRAEEEARERQRKYREAEEERKKAERQRFNDAWTNGTVRDKLNTYQLPKLHILAEQKGILKYQRYERDDLIDTLLKYTTPRDLPIR